MNLLVILAGVSGVAGIGCFGYSFFIRDNDGKQRLFRLLGVAGLIGTIALSMI